MNSREESGFSRALQERLLRLNLEAFLAPVLGPTESMAILCNVSFQNSGNKGASAWNPVLASSANILTSCVWPTGLLISSFTHFTRFLEWSFWTWISSCISLWKALEWTLFYTESSSSGLASSWPLWLLLLPERVFTTLTLSVFTPFLTASDPAKQSSKHARTGQACMHLLPLFPLSGLPFTSRYKQVQSWVRGAQRKSYTEYGRTQQRE